MARRAVRGCGLVAVAVGAGALLSAVAPTPARLLPAVEEIARHPQSTVDTQGADGVTLTVVAALAWLVLVWLIAALVLVGAAAAPGRVGAVASGLSTVLVPAATRRVLAAALGVTLMTAGGAGAALAAPAAPAPAPTAISELNLDWPVSATGPPAAPAPLGRTAAGTAPHTSASAAPRPPAAGTAPQTPGRNAPRPPEDHTASHTPALATPRPPDHAGDEVVVQRGDTLWSIAARHLGAGATDDEITREWPRWWSANRGVVGDDPDLIKPGQRLAPPPAER